MSYNMYYVNLKGRSQQLLTCIVMVASFILKTAGFYFTTKLTSFPGTTISLMIFLLSRNLEAFSEAFA